MTAVPKQYQAMVNTAARALGISPAIVAAQINEESGFNPGAVSPTGAQGIAQFEPGTWASYGTGSPFNAANAFAAYATYMGTLLREFRGNVRNALAAYNAGPGNIQAGMGYADMILSAAGSGTTTTSTGVTLTSAQGGPAGRAVQGLEAGSLGAGIADPLLGTMMKGVSWITGLANEASSTAIAIAGIANDISQLMNWASFLFMPSSWLRVGAFFAGVILLIMGAFTLAKAAGAPTPHAPSVIPVPVPV